MELKIVFYDKKKNNAAWWNRLYDRIAKFNGKRKWKATGGAAYGSPEVVFALSYEDGSKIEDQESVNQIIWCFFIEQLNVAEFYIDKVEVTNTLKYR